MKNHPFSNYEKAVDYLFSTLPMYQRIGPKALKYDLSTIILFMEVLGNPHQCFKSIHIAGTNGKGSTAHLLSGGFQANAFKTGLYTSPHYKDYRERIKLNGQLIEKEAVLEFMQSYYEDIERIKPSYFELSVAMAFWYFAKVKVDVAIIEVGLGGRLDSTNIIDPLLSVITNISLDHMQTLGDDIPSIAREKGGIIKANRPLLVGEKQEETSPVFEDIAKNLNAPVHYAEEIDLDIPDFVVNDVQLKGPFFKKNALTALGAFHVFKKYYPEWSFEDDKFFEGMQNVDILTQYTGRWKILSQKPMVIADGAHNQGSWEECTKHLSTLEYNRLFMVIGFVFDKSLDPVLKLMPEDAHYLFCQASVPRAMDASNLKEYAARYNLKGNSYPTVLSALEAAKKQAKEDDIIFVGGSIFVVGEIL